MCVCVCVCVYIHIYIRTYIHTHTHAHTPPISHITSYLHLAFTPPIHPSSGVGRVAPASAVTRASF